MPFFDFFVLSFGRVGTQALYTMLTEHPEITSPYLYYADEIFSRFPGREKELFPQTLQAKEKDKKGLFLHDPKLLQRLKPSVLEGLVAKELCIHLVRDPLESLLSHYNHEILLDCLGKKKAPLLEDYCLGEALDYLRFERVASPFYTHFANVHFIDCSDLEKSGLRASLKTLYSLIGVDASFFSRRFYQKQNGAKNFLRRFLFMQLRFQGHHLLGRFMKPSDFDHSFRAVASFQKAAKTYSYAVYEKDLELLRQIACPALEVELEKLFLAWHAEYERLYSLYLERKEGSIPKALKEKVLQLLKK